jgi:hypothetical protein
VPRGEGAFLVDGAQANTVDELTTVLLSAALGPEDAAPVVRIYEVDLGVRHLGEGLLRALLVTADLLRARGSHVILSGWPSDLGGAADLFITRADAGGGYIARRRGERGARAVNLRPY